MREGSFGAVSEREVHRIQAAARRRVDAERATRPEITDEQMRQKQFRMDAKDAAGGMTSGDLGRSNRAKK